MYYSKSTGGFYDDSIHKTIPFDAVSVTKEEWQNLIEEQSNGKKIVSNEHGYPISVDHNLTVDYFTSRRHSYPDVREFADAYYWMIEGDNSKMEEYLKKCKAIKNKYPKP